MEITGSANMNFMRGRHALPFLLLFALVFVRFCYFGFEYYHQLDDYIQYHNYALMGHPFDTIKGLGLLGARPLAGLFDIFVWSHFFPVMIVAVALISAMFSASACLLWRVWSRFFGTGYVFLAVYALLPLGIEGTYWVSASSRIVLGLFFASISLHSFDRWCREGRRRALILYILAQAAAFGFYEQALVFSLTTTILVAVLRFRENRPRALWGLFSFVNASAYFIMTGLVKNSALYDGRLGLIESFDSRYWSVTFPAVLNQVRDVFLKGGFYTLVKGSWRGAQMMLEDANIVYILAVLFLCAALYILACKKAETCGTVSRPAASLLVGLLLALAPVSIFFVIDNAWFSLRGAVMSFCGLALIADTLVRLLASKIKYGVKFTALAVSCFALICCVASVSEIHDYRETTAKDREIVGLLAEKLEKDGRLDKELKIAVLNVEPSYLPNQNYFFHEHIHGVTESPWALTGALEWRVGRERPRVTPLPGDIMYKPWNIGVSRLSNFDCVYFYSDGEIGQIRTEPISGESYRLFDLNGGYIGRIWEEDDYGYLELP